MVTQKSRISRDNITDLASLGGMRVWSILITIFGDAVAPRGGDVPATVLQAILERLNIKPEAMRVALHRLVKDGWITRQKTGRQSYYALSGRGRAEFLSASQRIYATGPSLTGPWSLALLPQSTEAQRQALGAQLIKSGYVALTSTAFLGTGQTRAAPKDVLQVDGSLAQFPDWARNAIAPAPLPQEYARLADTLNDTKPESATDALDAVALRILMVHQWRRLLLRHADLPPHLFPKGWRGEETRQTVLSHHARLSHRADPWLDAQIAPATPPDQPGA